MFKKLIIILLLASLMSGCGFFKDTITNSSAVEVSVAVGGGMYYAIKDAVENVNFSNDFECVDQWCYMEERCNY